MIMFVFFVAMLLLAVFTDKSERMILESTDVGYADSEIFIANEELRNNSK